MQLTNELKNKLNTEQISFLQNFFLKCPDSMASCIYIRTFKPGHVLISSDDSCGNVYILLKGRLQAIEEHVADEDFRFLDINAIEIIGDFELFSSYKTRLVTLTTVKTALCLVIPAREYISWIKNDSHALFIRIQMLISQLASQTQTERQKYFMDNRTKLLRFLYDECQKLPSANDIKISVTRQLIASHLGCSLRTVNRFVSALEKEGIISLRHGKIHISENQLKQIETLFM